MFIPLLFLLIIVSCIILIPDAYAHPIALKAGIGGDGKYFVIDLVDTTTKSDDELGFMSYEWMQKNPVSVLGMGIAVFMINYVVIVFREDISKKITNLNIK